MSSTSVNECVCFVEQTNLHSTPLFKSLFIRTRMLKMPEERRETFILGTAQNRNTIS